MPTFPADPKTNNFYSNFNGNSSPLVNQEIVPIEKPDLSIINDIKEPEMTLLKTCAACFEPISNNGYFINGQYYHQDCYACQRCNKPLSGDTCIVYQDCLCCHECARLKPDFDQAEKCNACNFPIYSNHDEIIIPELNQHYHVQCLSCYQCSNQIDMNYYDGDNLNDLYQIAKGQILCNKCAKAISQRVCQSCKERIIGDYIYCYQHYYHPDHFKCTTCDSVLSGSNFLMHHNLPYCFKCGNIFNSICSYCKGPFKVNETDKIKWYGKYYHSNCFVCRVCGVPLDPTVCKKVHGRPHCEQCFACRIEDGECDESGKSISHHKHKVQELNQKREKYKLTHGIQINYPRYGEGCCEVAEYNVREEDAKFTANF